MKKESIEKFIKIPQPPRDSFGFLEDIKKPLEYHFAPGLGCDAGVCAGCMADGAEIIIDHPRNADSDRISTGSIRSAGPKDFSTATSIRQEPGGCSWSSNGRDFSGSNEKRLLQIRCLQQPRNS